MPNDQGTVQVLTTEKQETYAINGTTATYGDAIGKFVGEDEDVEELFDSNKVSIQGREIGLDDLDKDLRANDVILIVGKRLASGGIKGA